VIARNGDDTRMENSELGSTVGIKAQQLPATELVVETYYTILQGMFASSSNVYSAHKR
jgi:hypothetical protein